jgi:hypothetical protein
MVGHSGRGVVVLGAWVAIACKIATVASHAGSPTAYYCNHHCTSGDASGMPHKLPVTRSALCIMPGS